mmetsp:Transcript_20451/g.23160  ORF Transcript_20451/g.23160 Transcript_20451/m.23160 type:complete len:405 (+) Transcript_20451:75-1289(+)
MQIDLNIHEHTNLLSDTVWLVSKSNKRFGPFFIDLHHRNKEHILLGCRDEEYLVVKQKGDTNFLAKKGPVAQFKTIPALDASFRTHQPVVFLCKAHKDKGWYLTDTDGTLMGNGSSDDPNIKFRLAPASKEETDELIENGPKLSDVFDLTGFQDDVDLTTEQRESFKKNGFVQIKGVIPCEMVNEALALINNDLLKRDAHEERDGKNNVFCHRLIMNKTILGLLYKSPAWTLVQRLLGKGNASIKGAPQIALKAPTLNKKNNDEQVDPTGWHTDGTAGGQYSAMTMLVGITLSAQREPNCGNLCVHPGSHEILLPIYRKKVQNGEPSYDEEGSEPRLALPNGIHVLAEPGDIILAHQKLAHQVAPNTTSNIRYQIYFRIRHKNHSDYIKSGVLLDDLWVEFEGL